MKLFFSLILNSFKDKSNIQIIKANENHITENNMVDKNNFENKSEQVENFISNRKSNEFILVKTKEENAHYSRIEVILPSPYLSTDIQKNYDWQIKSKYKSLFADYVNNNTENDSSLYSNKINNEININRTSKKMIPTIEMLNHIYFTNNRNNCNYINNIILHRKNN